METLDRSVKDFEPHLALCGGEDGLDFYRAIVRNWKAALTEGGRMYFEVGAGQADAVLGPAAPQFPAAPRPATRRSSGRADYPGRIR